MSDQEIRIGGLVNVQAQNPRTRLAGSAICERFEPGQAQDQALTTAGAHPRPEDERNQQHRTKPPLPCTIEVPELWPGERAQVRILARSKHEPRYFAKLHTLHDEHLERQDPPCTHHGQRGAKPACGGCPWMTLSVHGQRAIKREILVQQFNYPFEAIVGASAQGYRHSSKRIVGRVQGRLCLGSYVPRSHHLAPMSGCLVDHPKLSAAFNLWQDLLIKHRVAPYDELQKSGEARFVWGKCSDTGVHITSISAGEKSPRLHAALVELAQTLGPGNAVSWQRHDQPGNAMRSSAPVERIDEHAQLPSIELLSQVQDLDALGFLQPNPSVAQACYRALLGLDQDTPPTGALALDLYAGGGATSLALGKNFKQVRACELAPPQDAPDLVEHASTEDFLTRYLAEHPPNEQPPPDFVVANPPRAGLSEQAISQLIKLAPPRIAIMSCGPEGLARNLEALAQAGYERTRLCAFDPLPHTAHVEIVAHLRLA